MLKLARILVLITALLIMGIGLVAGAAGLLLATLTESGDSLMMTTASVSFLAITVGLGALLAWQAWRTIREKASARFRAPPIWALALLFCVSVVAGRVVLSRDLLPTVVFPPLHVLASALPPLMVVAFAGRRLANRTRWRDVVLQVSSGTFLSTTVAFTLELVLVILGAIVMLLVVALLPDGAEQLQELAIYVEGLALQADPNELAALSRSPLVIIGALGLMAVAAPLIEESVKTLGVGLMAYRRPSQSEAYLWGIAGGAGFALFEGMFSSLSGLDAWAPTVLARVGSTALHCLAGGLVGLAWHAVLADRRWGRALGLFAGSVALHGLWNGLAVGSALISLASTGEGMNSGQALLGIGSLGMMAALVFLAIVVIVGLVLLTRWVSARNDRSVPKREDAGNVEESHEVRIESSTEPTTLPADTRAPSAHRDQGLDES